MGAQIAEEINGFSALSGPVTVATEGNAKFKVTFDAADGDVAQLEAHATDAAKPVSVVTRENGWSIEAPIGTNLDTMQAGGTINVTAREECKFTVSDVTGTPAFYFCYDGVCGSETVGAADPDDALASIQDDNGVAILSLAAADAGYATNVFTIQLPMGKSCDGLEMRAKTIAAGGTITKDVDKHNNGKVFKITRSFVQVEEAAPGTVTGAAATAFTFTDGKAHSALAKASTVVITQKSGLTCAAHSGDFGFPIYRTISDFGTAHGGAAAVADIAAIDTTDCGTACAANSNCDYSLRRYVITLDSMPTASTTGTHTLLYKSPVGSCNVAETTKGTFESYECSNRGACDGKSGLCACYEGYSGESCQTQTVLV